MKKAFTLTEILVALAIIGTISAFSLVQIKKNDVKQNIILYKKTFTDMQEVISRISGDPLIFPLPEHGMKYGTGSDDLKDINTAKDAQYLCLQITKRFITNAGKSSDFEDKIANGDIVCNNALSPPTDVNFETNIELTNGVQIAGLGQVFKITTADEKDNFLDDYFDICVDTNGTKGPNKGCTSENTNTSARDRFRIRIFDTGKVSLDDTWKFENEILNPENSSMDLKSEDYSEVKKEHPGEEDETTI